MGVTEGHGRVVSLAETGKGWVPGKDGGARAGPERMGWLGVAEATSIDSVSKQAREDRQRGPRRTA